jgi:DNA mismatch repair protein MutS
MIIDDYLEYTATYKAKYGEKTIVLMQVGSFYELYSVKDDTSEDIYNIADLCNIQISKKNKSITDVSISNPLMAGFPLYTLKKFTNILLNNNYTIVLIEQVTEPPNPERKVTEILSPGMNINIENKRNNFMMVLYYEFVGDLPTVGISGIDLSTGNSFVYEAGSSLSDPEFINDEVFRLITTYNPCEIIILSDKKYDDRKKSNLIKHLNLSKMLVHQKWETFEHITQMSKIPYQTVILQKAFKNKSMLSIIEHLNLEKYQLGRVALCCLLQFAYEHNVDIIKHLNTPEIINDNMFLNIEYNSAVQLNILGLHQNDKPLVDILNRCITSFGSRMYRERLLKPIIDNQILNKRYDDIEYLLTDKRFQNVSKHLCGILDLERIKRKMLINKLHPQDWNGFNTSLENAIIILDKYYDKYDTKPFKDMMNYYSNILDLQEASKYNINDIKGNIFVKGVYTEIDQWVNEFERCYQVILKANNNINGIDNIGDSTACKIDYSDKEGYHICMTKKRYESAKMKDPTYMKEFKVRSLSSANMMKIVNQDMIEASSTMDNIQSDISKSVGVYYHQFLSEFIEKYESTLIDLIDIIADIDISCCNAKNAFEYRYYRPCIVERTSSFIKADNIRHPIIERIDDSTSYIGNDICLSGDGDNSINGMLLYGINASGKSSLMKSIGLNIVMAQSGMYVASSNMEFCPYKHIFTRISGMDNIYKGMSSFTVEMTELRNILQRCDKYSLVLGDEVCSGTEAISALAIVATGIDTLVKKKAGFIFATHLHDLTTLDIVKQYINKYITVKHIHISIDDQNRIVYERKLREGKGHDTYGIEVCKSLDMPNDFMKTAENVRKEIQGYSNLMINTTRSKYNNGLYMTECYLCKGVAEDTHHINYQSLSDDGFFRDFHQDMKHNLIPLCKSCHKKEHNGEIHIKGYKKTSDGVVIDYVDNKEMEYNVNPKQNSEELTDDEFNRLRQYIKRGKCNWYIRMTKTNVFKICSNEKRIIEKINKILKRVVITELSDDHVVINQLYDPTV